MKKHPYRPDVSRGDSSVSNDAWDWIDNCGMDILGCEGTCANASRSVLGKALNDPSPSKEINLHDIDYASMHDEFLESLLYEQVQLRKDGQSTEELNVRTSSSSSTLATASSSSATELEENTGQRKRRRALRIHRRKSPARIRPTRVAPLPDSDMDERDDARDSSSSSKSNSSETISFTDFSKSEFPRPSTYLHPLCVMQKDKGKGEPVGSNFCAKNNDACLEKLRDKMRLLTSHAMSPSGNSGKKGPATMKRRKARVSEHYKNFVETRSLIELRMGFLSMQYGVLLRWDTGRTGKANLVVLRKMCHDSFYPEKPLDGSLNSWRSAQQANPATQARDVVCDSNAIMERPDGTEVSLLEPPFLVPQPVTFHPTQLTVSVLYATGLSRRSNWTVQLTHGDQIENILLSFDSDRRCLMPKLGGPLKHKTENMDLAPLEIKLYEHRLRRRNERRLVTTMKVPLSSLEPQPHMDNSPTRMRIPFQHESDSALQIELLLSSDYAYWLNKELDARRAEESTGFIWKAPFLMMEYDKENEENDPWDWICSVC